LAKGRKKNMNRHPPFKKGGIHFTSGKLTYSLGVLYLDGCAGVSLVSLMFEDTVGLGATPWLRLPVTRYGRAIFLQHTTGAHRLTVFILRV